MEDLKPYQLDLSDDEWKQILWVLDARERAERQTHVAKLAWKECIDQLQEQYAPQDAEESYETVVSIDTREAYLVPLKVLKDLSLVPEG